VPDDAHAREIQRRVERAQVVDRGGHVGERVRPPAAVAQAAVLDVPYRQPAAAQIARERARDALAVALVPRAAVDQHDDRMRPGVARQVQLGVLLAVLAVAVQGSSREHHFGDQACLRRRRHRRRPLDAPARARATLRRRVFGCHGRRS